MQGEGGRHRAPRFVISPRRGVLARDQTWIQSVAVGQEKKKPFLSVPAGPGWLHVSSCQAQLQLSEACSEVAPSIRSGQRCNPVKYHRVLEVSLIRCWYRSPGM